MSAFGIDFGTAAGLDLGLDYGGSPSYGFARGTGPTVPAPQGGFSSVLGDLATLTEAGADVYRAIKGYPARYNVPQTRFAANDLGSFLTERKQAREASPATSETQKQEERDVLMAERIRQIFENPDVLKDLFTDTALSNIIDPTKVGVRMDVTPPTPWRPVTPKAPK